jgi:hypothetical protein
MQRKPIRVLTGFYGEPAMVARIPDAKLDRLKQDIALQRLAEI